MHLLYSFSLKKQASALIVFVFLCVFFTQQTHAATLASASATLSTSRPSASSPLSANAALGSGQLAIFSNGSRYLASDSAKIIHDTTTHTGTNIINNNLLIASQSAGFTSVFLSNTTGTAAGAGADVLFVPITAMHVIRFTTSASIPSGGKIVLNYPGITANNDASPSASTFAFNNLQSANVVSNPAGACSGGVSVSSPTITCTTSGGTIAGNTTITILVGCSAQSGGSCTAQVPTLINPTKSATAGTADIWKVGIQTQDVSSVVIDSATIALGTIESVTVRATIDPSLTFTIAGVNSGTALSGVIAGCSQADTTNSGINSTESEVGLGTLSVVPTANNLRINNIAAQTLSVATNGANGYSITATSSGRLINPATGFFLNSSLTPLAFPTTGHFFGAHACGLDTDLTKWETTTSTACNTYRTGSVDPVCKYAWPTQTTPILIAQNNVGPIGNGASCFASGCGLNLVSYAATQDVTLPPGSYQSVITYVATPSF